MSFKFINGIGPTPKAIKKAVVVKKASPSKKPSVSVKPTVKSKVNLSYQDCLMRLCNNIKTDYNLFISDPQMQKNFADNISIKYGRKFQKIICKGSVWGFVAKDDGVHKGIPYVQGDVFKPASWSAPAKHVRGSIWDKNIDWYKWTGPNYR
tara:strand:+ start:524 stop:976 length:453 start_codon:yes stop_codon:yes gene_type:complete